jgi:ligand-binding sensor domain-containing protein
MKWLILIIFSILATPFHYLRAQSYSSIHYDTKDGLPSSTVYDISQDKNGFVWFATENGLSRFDGKNFKTFTTKDGLPDNSILNVHGDNSGRVYFTPFTYSLYYYQNDSFFKMPIPDKYKIDLSTISIFINKKNKVLLSGITDSYILDGDSLISFQDKYKKNPKLFFIKKVYDTLILAGTEDSLFSIPDSGKISSQVFKEVFNENAKLDQLNSKEKSVFIPGKYVSDSYLSRNLSNTINLYSTLTGDIIYQIKVEKFSNAFVDNENNLWISTLGDGVYRFPSFGFRNFNFGGKNEIFSLIKIGSQLVAGTDFSKMYTIPLKNAGAPYSTTDLTTFTARSSNPVAHFTKRNRIFVLHAQGNKLYIGADAFLLKKTGSSTPVFRNIYPVKDIDVSDKEILVCTGRYVLLLNEQDMSVKDTLLKQRTTCGIAYQGDYYIGTLGGLIKINKSTKAIAELFSSYPAFRGRITALKKGIDDDLWIATSGSGLIHFKNGKIVQVLKEEDGLTSNICTSIFIDSNLIWLGTNKGLNRIETGRDKNSVTSFTSANGLGADFINAVLVADTNVYVGTSAGLTVFSKNSLTEKSICILHILQISENNKRLKKDSIYSFPYNALNIQIDFTAISFKSAGDMTYYYQLKGLDDKWNTTTANSINFSTLHPGGYTLYLKAINKFGVKSDTEVVRITIRPPWWQTWLFRITALLVLGSLVLIIYRYNIRNFKRKEELKREFESRFLALEQKALQAQMNPHFIFNALNSIQNFILNLDVEGANDYLSSFASLIRQTLENSMQPFITVASELKYLETYLSLEKLRFRDKFEYTIITDESIDQNNTLLPGMLLQPYIENSIRHGIQHRKDNNGLISLSISKTSDNDVLYTISDNGVGRKKAQELKSSRHIQYQSRGISINEKRIAAINNQFKIHIRIKMEDIMAQDGTVEGTRIIVVIPPNIK